MTGGQDSGNTEFSPRYKAGRWAARIGTQDKVALIVAVELLGSKVELLPPWSSMRDGRIAFEAREDFEIRWDDGRQYVSVKDKNITRADLIQGTRNLQKFTREVADVGEQSLRIEAAGVDTGARSFYEDIEKLRERQRSDISGEYASARAEFEREHGLSADFAAKLVVAERRIGDSKFSAAMFAHAMRTALPVFDYSDRQLLETFNELSAKLFREKREGQGVLDLVELERRLLTPLLPASVAAFDTYYVATQYGYLLDKDHRKKIFEEEALVGRFARKLMKEWRRRTFATRMKYHFTFIGPVRCVACNHPMMGNFHGRNGVACPDCGYQPFLTLFWACDCGSGGIVVRQPKAAGYILVKDAISLLREQQLSCMECKKEPRSETYLGRIFPLPIPYPLDDYNDRSLIELRKKLGWRGFQWVPPEGTDLSPRDVMLSTSVDDPELDLSPDDF